MQDMLYFSCFPLHLHVLCVQVEKAVSKMEDHTKTAVEIREQLCRMRGTPGYLDHLVVMLEQIRNFISSCEVKKTEWVEERKGGRGGR